MFKYDQPRGTCLTLRTAETTNYKKHLEYMTSYAQEHYFRENEATKNKKNETHVAAFHMRDLMRSLARSLEVSMACRQDASRRLFR